MLLYAVRRRSAVQLAYSPSMVECAFTYRVVTRPSFIKFWQLSKPTGSKSLLLQILKPHSLPTAKAIAPKLYLQFHPRTRPMRWKCTQAKLGVEGKACLLKNVQDARPVRAESAAARINSASLKNAACSLGWERAQLNHIEVIPSPFSGEPFLPTS